MIKLDSTQISVVVKCTLCPHWYGFGFDRPMGWAVGAAHEENVHPGEDQARKVQRMTRRRAT